MTPRPQRRIRIMARQYRLAVEKARFDFDAYARANGWPEALFGATCAALLGGMMGWGF